MRLIRKSLQGKASEWVNLCCMSDIHFGNIKCDKNKLIKYLDEAKEKQARILIVGDIFDLLLPKDMKRFQMSVLDDYLKQRDDIINQVVSKFCDLLKPYASLIDLISLGNHEADLIKYHSIDPIVLLIGGLNQYLKEQNINHKISHGGYVGFLQYVVKIRSGGCTGNSFNIFYYHGKGGESAVTKGMIDIARMRANIVYDLHIFGHKHNLIVDSSVNVIPTGKGKVDYRPCKSVQCGTFLKTYIDGDVSNVSFEERAGFAAKETGCGFVRFRWTGHGSKFLEIRAEI